MLLWKYKTIVDSVGHFAPTPTVEESWYRVAAESWFLVKQKNDFDHTPTLLIITLEKCNLLIFMSLVVISSSEYMIMNLENQTFYHFTVNEYHKCKYISTFQTIHTAQMRIINDYSLHENQIHSLSFPALVLHINHLYCFLARNYSIEYYCNTQKEQQITVFVS